MNDRWLHLYQRLPYFLKVTAASAWGYYLRWWRYGPETERLVEEALERETWSLEKWQAWQEERLAFILHRAATRVPYYREHWSQRRRQGDRASWEYLENWPVLEKEPLRQQPLAFVADDCDIKRLYSENTSGSTGKPLDLWFSKNTLQAWYALSEARWRRWYGVSLQDRWAILGGKLITPFQRRTPPFWVWNAGLNQLYMSTYHTAPDLIPYYLDALKRYRIQYLYGYSSSLAALAFGILHSGRRDLSMSVVITNAETLFPYQRKAIAEAFHCPVRETYGMSEKVVAASECEAGRLHLWPEVGFVEVFHNTHPAAPGCTGNLVCTGLLNPDMPLIRYRVLDRGALPLVDSKCICKCNLPNLASLDGREADCLYTIDGRLIAQPDTLFESDMNLKEAQIIQEAPDQIRIRFVPAQNYNSLSGRLIIKRMHERMGPVLVSLEQVNYIERDTNGKFRYVICKLTEEERKKLSDRSSI